MSTEKHSHKQRETKIGHYKILKILGEGTFGKVKLCINETTNEKFAVKILETRKIKEKDDEIRVYREINMIKTFDHPNLTSVYEIFFYKDSYYIVMDYCEGGELFNYIVKHRRLEEDEAAFFYYQIIEGLEYIHQNKIAHRDLKPENLLLTKNKTLKIIDFGLSNYFDGTKLLATPCGSPCYASPEMVSGKKYNGFQIDIWSTGIILYAMLCGYLPFEDKNNEVLFKKILKCKYELPSHIRSRSKDLMRKILVTNPNERITIAEIKKHPFYLRGKEIFGRMFISVKVDPRENAILSLGDNGNGNNEIENKSKPKYNSVKTEENDLGISLGKKNKGNNNGYQQQLLVSQKEDDNIKKVVNDNNEKEKEKEKEKEIEQQNKINQKQRRVSKHKVINTEPDLSANTYRNTKNQIPTKTKQYKTNIIGSVLKSPNKYSLSPFFNYNDTINFNTLKISTKHGHSVQKNNNHHTITTNNNTNSNTNNNSTSNKPVTINNKTINNTVINFNLFNPNLFVDVQKRSRTKPKMATSMAKQSTDYNSERQKANYKYSDIISKHTNRQGIEYADTALKTQENYSSYLTKYKKEFMNNNNSIRNSVTNSNGGNYATIVTGGGLKKHLKINSMKIQTEGNNHVNYTFNSGNGMKQNGNNRHNPLTGRLFNGINTMRLSMGVNKGKLLYLKDLLSNNNISKQK